MNSVLFFHPFHLLCAISFVADAHTSTKWRICLSEAAAATSRESKNAKLSIQKGGHIFRLSCERILFDFGFVFFFLCHHCCCWRIFHCNVIMFKICYLCFAISCRHMAKSIIRSTWDKTMNKTWHTQKKNAQAHTNCQKKRAQRVSNSKKKKKLWAPTNSNGIVEFICVAFVVRRIMKCIVSN